MDVWPIESEADYDWALKEIEQCFDNEPARTSPEGQRLTVLMVLIKDYEDKQWPIPRLDPIDAITELMRERSLRSADLARVIGSRSRASELLARKRALTMEQAWKLHREWHIPAEILLQPSSAR